MQKICSDKVPKSQIHKLCHHERERSSLRIDQGKGENPPDKRRSSLSQPLACNEATVYSAPLTLLCNEIMIFWPLFRHLQTINHGFIAYGYETFRGGLQAIHDQ